MKALVDILKQQVEKYRQLLEYSRAKTEVLVKNDLEGLDGILKEERKLLMKVTALENERMQIVEKLSLSLGIEPEEMKLEKLAAVAPEPFNFELHEIYEELNELIIELDRLNRENTELIEQALRIVNYNLELIAETPREVTYGEHEESAKTKNVSRIFDGKA